MGSNNNPACVILLPHLFNVFRIPEDFEKKSSRVIVFCVISRTENF